MEIRGHQTYVTFAVGSAIASSLATTCHYETTLRPCGCLTSKYRQPITRAWGSPRWRRCIRRTAACCLPEEVIRKFVPGTETYCTTPLANWRNVLPSLLRGPIGGVR